MQSLKHTAQLACIQTICAVCGMKSMKVVVVYQMQFFKVFLEYKRLLKTIFFLIETLFSAVVEKSYGYQVG